MAYLLIAAIITRRGLRGEGGKWRRMDRGTYPPSVIRRRVYNRVSEIGCSALIPRAGNNDANRRDEEGTSGERAGGSGRFD